MSKQDVKERVINYLVNELDVPLDMIDTEVLASEFEEGSEGTIDILVNVKDESEFHIPVLLIQCVEEGTKLEGEVLQEEIDKLEEFYNLTLAKRLVLTNGNDQLFVDLGAESEEEMEDTLPTYEQMVNELREEEALYEDHYDEDHEHNHEEKHEHQCSCGHEHGEDHECCGGDCGCNHDK